MIYDPIPFAKLVQKILVGSYEPITRICGKIHIINLHNLQMLFMLWIRLKMFPEILLCSKKLFWTYDKDKHISPLKFFSPNGCGVRKLIEYLLKSIGKSSLLKCRNACFDIRNFLSCLEAIFLQSLHLPLQPKPHPSPHSKFLWTKIRDDIRPQINKRHWSGSSRFLLPLHSKSNTKGPAWNHGE